MNRRGVLLGGISLALVAAAGNGVRAIGPSDLAALSMAQMREDFNKARDKVRLLTILSPT